MTDQFTDEEIRASEYRLMDAAKESRYAYWNALLSLNGILISVFSALGVLSQSNKWMIIGLVVLSIISAWMLIQNYRTLKNLYLLLGQMTADEVDALTEEQKKNQLKEQVDEHDAMNKREDVVERLLIVQAILILLVVFT